MRRKVAHITFDMRIGGAEQVIYHLVRHTDPAKYDSRVLCIDSPPGPFGHALQRAGIEIKSFTRRPGFDTALIRHLRTYIKTHDIDILHCHQYTPYVYGVLSAVRTRTKVVYTEHGRFYPDRRKLKRILVNPLLSLITDRITAISDATRSALVRYENFPRNRIQVIYNGLDDARFSGTRNGHVRTLVGLPPNARVLGTVARLDPIKNHAMMLRALKRICQALPDTYLVIVGDGPERENLQTLAAQLDVSKNIIMTGFRENIEEYYSMMDVFLLTSFSEGTAMTLLEAMAAGLPAIVTDVGGNQEIIQDGDNGLVVASGDDHTLAEKVLSLLQDEEQAQTMGRAARQRYLTHFTVNKMTRSYQQLYDDLLRSHHH